MHGECHFLVTKSSNLGGGVFIQTTTAACLSFLTGSLTEATPHLFGLVG